MKVKELIEELQRCWMPDAPVYFYDGESKDYPFLGIYNVRVTREDGIDIVALETE